MCFMQHQDRNWTIPYTMPWESTAPLKKTLAVANTENISHIIKETDRLNNQEADVRRTEYKLNRRLIVEHNCAIKIMNHVSNLMKNCFPDSRIAAFFKCKRTKSNAPYYERWLSPKMSSDCSLILQGIFGRQRQNYLSWKSYKIFGQTT